MAVSDRTRFSRFQYSLALSAVKNFSLWLVRKRKIEEKTSPKINTTELPTQNNKKNYEKVINNFPERPAERRGLLGGPNEMKLRGAGTNPALGVRLVHFITLRNNSLGSGTT